MIEKAPDSFPRNQANQAEWSETFQNVGTIVSPWAPHHDRHPMARTAEYERVRDLHLDDLKPRKTAFTIPGTSDNEPDFNGLFDVRRTAADGGQDRVDLLLLRIGNDVNGGYSSGKTDGFIEGKIVDGVLHFTWREGNANGKGIAQAVMLINAGHGIKRSKQFDSFVGGIHRIIPGMARPIGSGAIEGNAFFNP